jgi:NADH:ubiquinone oxidoreductase subunit H
MKKFILMSVLYAVLILPSLAARERNAVRGAKRAVAMFVAYNFLYAFLVLAVWTQMED